MLKRILPGLGAAALFALSHLSAAHAEVAGGNERAHPPMAHAIHVLEDAIAHMEASPDDFGGHRERAIGASRKAIQQLRDALFVRDGDGDREHRHHRR